MQYYCCAHDLAFQPAIAGCPCVELVSDIVLAAQHQSQTLIEAVAQ
jgi:hypothetical protein